MSPECTTCLVSAYWLHFLRKGFPTSRKHRIWQKLHLQSSRIITRKWLASAVSFSQIKNQGEDMYFGQCEWRVHSQTNQLRSGSKWCYSGLIYLPQIIKCCWDLQQVTSPTENRWLRWEKYHFPKGGSEYRETTSRRRRGEWLDRQGNGYLLG